MNRFIFASLLPLVATPALAGNIAPVLQEPAPVVAVAPVYEWSGPYVGAQLSYGRVVTDGIASVDGDGALFGLRAGYDLDLGSTVIGALVQYDTTNIELGATGAEIDNILRVGGRYGFDLGRTLVYGSLGYATADTNIVGETDGYFVGFGTEIFATESMTVGVETMYHDFGDFDGAPAVDAEAVTLGVNLNYRF